MTFKQLKAFLVLARTLNYANAANELCLSQSALSLSIKTLEDELGGKLFKRTTRRVEMTAEGQSLIPYAKKLLAHWEEMEKDVKQRFKLNRGTLNVASMSFVTHSMLPAVIDRFSKLHPNINFSIHDITHEKIIEKVQEGIFEIGICFRPEAYHQLTFHPLFDEGFIAVVPKKHPLSQCSSVAWQDLCKEPFVTLQHPSIVRQIIENQCQVHEIKLNVKVECHHINSLSHFTSYGLGVSAIPRHFQNFIDLEHNCLIEIADHGPLFPVGIIYKTSQDLSHISAHFVETLLAQDFSKKIY